MSEQETRIAKGALGFKERDAGSYDPVACRFAWLSDRFTAPFAEEIVSLAGLTARAGSDTSQRVLDVGTAAGNVAFHAAACLGAGAKVLGIDLSEGMLGVARSRASELPERPQNGATSLPTIEFLKMDAEALALEDHSYDTVLSLFALLHFPNPVKALREMYRVLRPGGRCVVAVGNGPPWWSRSGWIHRFKRLKGIVAESRGRQLTAPATLDRLIQKRLGSAMSPDETDWAAVHRNRDHFLSSCMRNIGFDHLKRRWTGRILEAESAEEFWDLQATFSSVSRKRLSEASPEAVTALREELFARCRSVQADGGRLVFPCAALFISAVRPL